MVQRIFHSHPKIGGLTQGEVYVSGQLVIKVPSEIASVPIRLAPKSFQFQSNHM